MNEVLENLESYWAEYSQERGDAGSGFAWADSEEEYKARQMLGIQGEIAQYYGEDAEEYCGRDVCLAVRNWAEEKGIEVISSEEWQKRYDEINR